MKIEFSIPMLPVAKQSARLGNGRTYQPKRVTGNAESLASLLAPYVPIGPLCGPVRLDVVYRYPWRVSEPKKRRQRARLKDTKPDHEQLNKQLCDVFEHMGFVTNDAQFADVRIRKFWTDQVGTDVMMEEVGE